MKVLVIAILFPSISITAFGQQTMPDDSGFTNKAEAKNQTIHGFKEGKWIEYYNLETKTQSTNPYKITIHVQTTDTNAAYYDLGIYKAGKLNGIVRYYYNKSNKLAFYHYFINGDRILRR